MELTESQHVELADWILQDSGEKTVVLAGSSSEHLQSLADAALLLHLPVYLVMPIYNCMCLEMPRVIVQYVSH